LEKKINFPIFGFEKKSTFSFWFFEFWKKKDQLLVFSFLEKTINFSIFSLKKKNKT
jgi:hypothetical protein